MTEEINEAQEIQFRRIEMGSFNNFDGEEIVKSLKENKDLWTSFVFGRFKYWGLIELRDLSSGYINADTIMMLAPLENVSKIEALAKKWHANEFGYNYMEGNKMSSKGISACRDDRELFHSLGSLLGEDTALIRLWWD